AIVVRASSAPRTPRVSTPSARSTSTRCCPNRSSPTLPMKAASAPCLRAATATLAGAPPGFGWKADTSTSGRPTSAGNMSISTSPSVTMRMWRPSGLGRGQAWLRLRSGWYEDQRAFMISARRAAVKRLGAESMRQFCYKKGQEVIVHFREFVVKHWPRLWRLVLVLVSVLLVVVTMVDLNHDVGPLAHFNLA